MARIPILISLLAAFVLVPVGAIGAGTPLEAAASATGATVDVGDFYFRDHQSGTGTSQVAVGETVTWEWVSGFHQVRHDLGAPIGLDTPVSLFRSPFHDGSGTYSETFDVPGAYTYYCTVHPQMKGTVLVTA